MTLLVWDVWLSIVQAIRTPSRGLPRHERRRLDKLAWSQRHTLGGRRLPLLYMLPSTWMVLTHVITLPIGNTLSIFQRSASPFCQAVSEIGQTITYLDQVMVLDTSVLLQINNIKGTHLFHSLVSPLDAFDLLSHCPVVIKQSKDQFPFLRRKWLIVGCQIHVLMVLLRLMVLRQSPC